jgi:hypothetical protein
VFDPSARVFDPFQFEWGSDSGGEARIQAALKDWEEGSCDLGCQVRETGLVHCNILILLDTIDGECLSYKQMHVSPVQKKIIS